MYDIILKKDVGGLILTRSNVFQRENVLNGLLRIFTKNIAKKQNINVLTNRLVVEQMIKQIRNEAEIDDLRQVSTGVIDTIRVGYEYFTRETCIIAFTEGHLDVNGMKFPYTSK